MTERSKPSTQDLAAALAKARRRIAELEAASGKGLDPLRYLPIAAYVDVVDDDGNVYLSFGSQRYEELSGIPPTALAVDAWEWDDHVHPDDLEAYQRSFDRMWRERVEQDIEYRFRRGDGWVWLRDRAIPVYDEERHVTVINGVLNDVTARRAAEEEAARALAHLEETVRIRTRELEESLRELRESEAKLEHAQELARVGAFEWNAVTESAAASDVLYEIYGFDHETKVDLPLVLAATHPDDFDRVHRLVVDSVAGREWGAIEYRVLRPDGSIRYVEARADVEHDGEGQLLRIFGSAQDVTERRLAEEEIRRLNAELAERILERTQQLDASTHELESLAYSISHELRAPLRTIEGFSAMIAKDARDRLTEDDLDHVARVRDAAQRLGRLIDDLLGLSRVSRRDMLREPCDLSSLAAQLEDEIRAEQPDREVELTIQPGLSAHADPALARLILRELLDNAWKFTAPRDLAHVTVGVENGDGERTFYVRDDGVGFDPRYADRLFGAFQRMHPPGMFEGNGIGLTTVQRLVRRHGGRVWAEAAVNEGVTVYFTLPDEGTG